MNLFDKVSGDIKTAMLARDKVRLEALRGIKKEFLEAKTAKGGDGELSDDAALKILAKMVKQRKESASIYTEQNREDLAGEELAQAAIIEEYLPKQLSEEELTAARGAIKKLGGEYRETRTLHLPGGDTRTLILCKKISQTPTAYPRNGGKIAKSPLK